MTKSNILNEQLKTEFNAGQTTGLVYGTLLGLAIGMILMMFQPSMPLDLTYSEYKEYSEDMKDSQQDYYDDNEHSFYY